MEEKFTSLKPDLLSQLSEHNQSMRDWLEENGQAPFEELDPFNKYIDPDVTFGG